MKDPWYCSGVRIRITILKDCFAIGDTRNRPRKKFRAGEKCWGEYWGPVYKDRIGFWFHDDKIRGYYALPTDRISMKAYPQCKEYRKAAVIKYARDLKLWLAGKRKTLKR